MKNLSVLLVSFIFTVNAFAQNSVPRPSPATETSGKIGSKTITINYGQPSVKGRKIWGELVPYGQVWRAGANETTSITFSNEVEIEGKKLEAGKYAFFVIPNEKEWTIIFNKTVKWGAFSYKQDEDVLRVNVPLKKLKTFTEKLTYSVSAKGVVSLAWENSEASFKVK